MAELIVRHFPVGFLQCNCTILGCPRTGEAIVFDPGGDVERILDACNELGLKVTRIAHTHAHLDHVLGTQELQAKTGAEVLLHPADAFLYDDVPGQFAMVGLPVMPVPTPPPVDTPLADEQELTHGDHGAKVLHCPGHTPGSVCFLAHTQEGPLLLSGDTLFQGSVGRTDLPGGDTQTLLTSIHEKLLVLPDGTRVIPGHGPETSIAFERQANPFLRG